MSDVMRVAATLILLMASCLLALILAACAKPEPLTAVKAEELIRGYAFHAEPVYAEVPRKVWWTPKSPKDDFDGKSVRTLENLKNAGLLTYTEEHTADSATYLATVTPKGFPILGTAPSYRGQVYRGKIAEKKIDGIRNFVRHPTETTTGQAELVWHYANPTPLYPLFETKLNKPLDRPFVSVVSFFWKDGAYQFDVVVRKSDPR